MKMISNRYSCAFFTIAVVFLSMSAVHAEHGPSHDDDHASHSKPSADLAKASQNPISSLVSVPFEFNNNFNTGPEDAYFQQLLIKPVVPVKLNENWSLINRAIVPVLYQEGLVSGQEDKWGLGDFTYQGFLTPAKPGKIIWGVGPSVVAPLGTNDRFSSDKWSLGPNAVVLTMPGHWVIGALVSQVWDVAGDSDAADVSSFTSQPFANYNIKKGWYLVSAPVITANWEADSSQRWTVPLGGGVGRVFKIGKQHINARVAGYYNVVKPDFGSDYDIQASVTFLFPK